MPGGDIDAPKSEHQARSSSMCQMFDLLPAEVQVLRLHRNPSRVFGLEAYTLESPLESSSCRFLSSSWRPAVWTLAVGMSRAHATRSLFMVALQTYWQ